MDLDRFIILIAKGVGSTIAMSANMAIRIAEHFKAWLSSRVPAQNRTSATQPIPSVGGVRAETLTAGGSSRPIGRPPAAAPVPSPDSPIAPDSPIESSPVTPTMESVDEQRPLDELDWAGSLSHAAVAGLHLHQVLAMVRAGWLVPDESRMAEVATALDAMEAFQDRTNSAIAPLLEVMSGDQNAEFFADFESDFPPELPELDEADDE